MSWRNNTDGTKHVKRESFFPRQNVSTRINLLFSVSIRTSIAFVWENSHGDLDESVKIDRARADWNSVRHEIDRSFKTNANLSDWMRYLCSVHPYLRFLAVLPPRDRLNIQFRQVKDSWRGSKPWCRSPRVTSRIKEHENPFLVNYTDVLSHPLSEPPPFPGN